MNARRDIVVFAAFFVVVMTLRAGAAMAASSTGLDGGYYVTVANALLRGEGLRSNLSMYNFGYSTFPGPSGVYPLWPMLLAAAGTVFDIDAAGHWLPWALYGVTGIGIFGFGQAVTPSPRPALHAGHLFAAGFMLSPWFFTWTIAPLTEGLAWAITSLGFWRFAVRGSDLSFRWGSSSASGAPSRSSPARSSWSCRSP